MSDPLPTSWGVPQEKWDEQRKEGDALRTGRDYFHPSEGAASVRSAGSADILRFIPLIRIDDSSGCWNWVGAEKAKGYGAFRLNGRCRLAHTASWELFIGKIASGMMVCHKCDNRRCVNPDHLFIGTAKDNLEDARAKMRWVPNKTPRWKTPYRNTTLSKADVINVRARRAMGESGASIARSFGVHRDTINKIIRGVTWTK